MKSREIHSGIRVRLEPQGRELLVRGPKQVASLLRQLKVMAGTALVIRQNHLLAEDDVLSDGDEVEIRSVISGGRK